MKNIKNDQFSTALAVVFLMTTSFLLGRFSEPEKTSNDIIILNTTDNGEYEDITYVASKQGSKYYFEWCSGAKKIKKGNKIYFNSQSGAVSAGYEKAKHCYGL